MLSFGFWHNRIERQESDEQINSDMELHINLWDIDDICIDFGIQFNDFRKYPKLTMFIPFEIDVDEEYISLSQNMQEVDTARLVFNENCDVGSVKIHYEIKCKNKQKFIICPESYTPKTDIYEENGNRYTILNYDFTELIQDATIAEYTSMYLRFRIQTSKLKDMLFCNVERKNAFLESAFTATHIMDLKVNMERNIPAKISHDFNQKLQPVCFNKVHFLVMEPASYEVEAYNNLKDCRKLEEGLWDNYLNRKNKPSLPDMLAYHWKADNVSSYSQLVKITYSHTDMKIIGCYILVALLLGAVGNELFSIIDWMIQVLRQIISSIMPA